MRILSVFILNMGIVSLGMAAAAADSAGISGVYSPTISPLVYVKILFLLGLVIALILGAVWVIKRISPQFNRRAQGGAIRIISSNWLGPKKALFLVEVLDRVILVGMTDNNISAIAEFTDGEEVTILKGGKEDRGSGPSFSSVFRSFLRGGTKG
ncbi:MAG: flagellar biosynthetic protein FliO [candidate division Zixibacteria bacterium]|nr:flagellar biosynthetic protein FliO [Candidatus Tariuqbacter arcticus]